MGELTPQLSAKLSLVRFIKQTAQFERFGQQVGWFQPMCEQPNKYQRERDISRHLINAGIRQLGGLAATIDATSTEPAQQVMLQEWHGADPVNSRLHHWCISGESGRGMTILPPEILDEIHDNLLVDFDPDV
jgi:hypothetical protein